LVVAAVVLGGLVYINSARGGAGHEAAAPDALGQQALDFQAKTGGSWKQIPGSVEGVVVLGMHRSGTSMVTGLLQEMGLHLGEPDDLLRAKEGENDKGFFERHQVVVQNDDIMEEQDVNWSLNLFQFDHLLALVSGSSKHPSFKAPPSFFSFSRTSNTGARSDEQGRLWPWA